MVNNNATLIHFVQVFDTPVDLSTTETVVELTSLADAINASNYKYVSVIPNPIVHCKLTAVAHFLSDISIVPPTKVTWAMCWSQDGALNSPQIDSALVFDVGSTDSGGAVVSQYPVEAAMVLTPHGTMYMRMKTDTGTCKVTIIVGSLEILG